MPYVARSQFPYLVADRGCIAQAPIPEGELILAEKPFLRMCEGEFVVPAQATQHPYWRDLRPAPHSFGQGETYDIFKGNALRCGMYRRNAITEAKAWAIFLRAASLNSSCEPNVHAHWNSQAEQMEFRTLRYLETGKELLICYDHRIVIRTTAERQDWLSKEFGFDCRCEACVNTEDESDIRREYLGTILGAGGSKDVEDVSKTGGYCY